MHQFICKSVGGIIVPLQKSKIDLLKKVLLTYEDLNKKFKVTIEYIEKNINEQQISLYNAFIMKASDHFGNSFQEMEIILISFYPKFIFQNSLLPKPINKWTSKELDRFINQATALLAEQGFSF